MFMFRVVVHATTLLVASVLAAAPAAAAVFTVTNTNPGGAGSLSAAISAANFTTAADQISFSIPGGGVKVIPAPLPAITEPLTIDGYTQPGSAKNTTAAGELDATILVQIDGTGLAGDGDSLIAVSSDKVTIRGVAIAGIPEGGAGIEIDDEAVIVTIDGCFIGTTATGAEDASAGYGIVNLGSGTIGGDAAGERNVISGNDAAGILQLGPNTNIYGNRIGLAAGDDAALANGIGIVVEGPEADEIDIGTSAATANEIAHSSGAGIVVEPDVTGVVRMRANSIHHNGDIGIDLGDDGITTNDIGDTDDGANGLQNFPELTFTVVGPTFTEVEGRLRGKTGSYEIDAFAAGGTRQAQKYLGSTTVVITEEDDGVATFVFDAAPRNADLAFITATATGSEGTSEISGSSLPVGVISRLVVTNGNDEGPGSLRDAIEAANENPDRNEIVFDTGGAILTAAIESTLIVEHGVVINGYSAAGSSPNTRFVGTDADIRVIVDGSASASSNGLVLNGQASVVRGLAIVNFPGNAIIPNDTARQSKIQGSFIGTDIDGTTAAGNGGGISTHPSADNLTIGGLDPSERNLISANGGHGIAGVGLGGQILGNLIGTTATGTPVLGNGGHGIVVTGDAINIGGEGGHNLIGDNKGAGVRVEGVATGVLIRGNSFRGNGGLGIDLHPAGEPTAVTPNDPGDADEGPNNLQNFPVITRMEIVGDLLEVEGFLDTPGPGTGSGEFEIQVYQSGTCDPSSHGEGFVFLGGAVVSAFDGNGMFELAMPRGAAEPGAAFTATATDTGFISTSEFSECYYMPLPPICGDASGDDAVKTADALLALRTAVGAGSCELCRCDVNDSGGVNSTDALRILRVGVGQNVTLVCPACA